MFVRILAGTSLAISSLHASALLGQTPSAQPFTMEEVRVTARKREEPLLEVPVSITAFTAEWIDKLRLVSMEDVARHTPGFSFASATGRQPSSDRPVIRGLTTIRNGIANSNVAATFVDGIYVGGSTQSTDLYNLERIEIIRGPQSAQYGRGTFAGAINYVTRRPTDEYDGEVRVTAAEHDSFELATWFSGPLVDDRLTLFLAAGHRRYGGEYHNARDGSTVGGEESSEATGKLYWSPSSALDVTLKLSLQDTDDDHFAIYLQPRTLNNCCFRSADAPRAREYFVGEAQSVDGTRLFTDLLDIAGGAGTELSRALATLDLRWTLESGQTFASLTGIVDDELRRGFDSSYAAYDPLPFAPGSFTRVDRLEQTDRSQELRLSSRADAAIRWTTGLYYYEGVLGEVTDERVFLDGSGSVVIAPNFGALTRDEIENIAVFGGAEWDVGERWTAGVELRWAADEVTVASRTNDDTRQLLDRFHARFSGFTPRFTLTHQADPRLSYYLSIAKGTNPGDFNSDVPSLPDGSPDERFRAVDEEQLWSYEAGLKGRWWQDRATGSASAYHVDVEDQQLTQIVELADGGTASIIQNVGRTQVYGLELQLSLALPQHLGLNATYAYTHAEIREHISTDEADLRGSDGSPGQNRLLGDVAGKRVPRVPEHSASLALRYDRPLADWGRWYLNADYTYESSRFAQEHNLIETGERSLVGLGAGIAGDQWEAGIWVANALDDDTPVDVVRYFDRRSGSLPAFPQQGSSRPSSSPRGFALTLPRGRQARATIRYRF